MAHTVTIEIGRDYYPDGWEPKNYEERFFAWHEEETGRWYVPIYGQRPATPEEEREFAHEEWINTPDSVKRELGLIW